MRGATDRTERAYSARLTLFFLPLPLPIMDASGRSSSSSRSSILAPGMMVEPVSGSSLTTTSSSKLWHAMSARRLSQYDRKVLEMAKPDRHSRQRLEKRVLCDQAIVRVSSGAGRSTGRWDD